MRKNLWQGSLILFNFKSWNNQVDFIFSVFLLIGIKTRDLSQTFLDKNSQKQPL